MLSVLNEHEFVCILIVGGDIMVMLMWNVVMWSILLYLQVATNEERWKMRKGSERGITKWLHGWSGFNRIRGLRIVLLLPGEGSLGLGPYWRYWCQFDSCHFDFSPYPVDPIGSVIPDVVSAWFSKNVTSADTKNWLYSRLTIFLIDYIHGASILGFTYSQFTNFPHCSDYLSVCKCCLLPFHIMLIKALQHASC